MTFVSRDETLSESFVSFSISTENQRRVVELSFVNVLSQLSNCGARNIEKTSRLSGEEQRGGDIFNRSMPRGDCSPSGELIRMLSEAEISTVFSVLDGMNDIELNSNEEINLSA